MNIVKIGIRLWFGIASLLGFLGGWILLAHSGKPAQPAQAAPLLSTPAPIPTLAPLPFANNGSSSQIQPIQPIQQPSFNFNFPPMRTFGS